MHFKMVHENYNVRDLDVSLRFYEKALTSAPCPRAGDAVYSPRGRFAAPANREDDSHEIQNDP